MFNAIIGRKKRVTRQLQLQSNAQQPAVVLWRLRSNPCPPAQNKQKKPFRKNLSKKIEKDRHTNKQTNTLEALKLTRLHLEAKLSGSEKLKKEIVLRVNLA